MDSVTSHPYWTLNPLSRKGIRMRSSARMRGEEGSARMISVPSVISIMAALRVSMLKGSKSRPSRSHRLFRASESKIPRTRKLVPLTATSTGPPVVADDALTSLTEMPRFLAMTSEIMIGTMSSDSISSSSVNQSFSVRNSILFLRGSLWENWSTESKSSCRFRPFST